MNDTAASLWQLMRDDYLSRPGAWVPLCVVWLAAAWVAPRPPLFPPAVAGGTWALLKRRGDPGDAPDLL